MAQFRLTQKFADDYKIRPLFEPSQTDSLFDDWVIDVVRIRRKKVAMVTHTRTLITFLISYAEVGGAKNIPACIPLLLKKLLNARGFSEYAGEITELFDNTPLFCKTQNQSILGHMNDFKRRIEAKTYRAPFEVINWDDLMAYLHNAIINAAAYARPLELVDRMLGDVPYHIKKW